MQGLFHPEIGCWRRLRKWIVIILDAGFLLSFSLSAEAGMVYGRVYSPQGIFGPGDRFELYDTSGKKVRDVATDTDGSYNLNIPEGTYRVQFTKVGRTWQAWIESFPQAIRQDVKLMPK
jgi:Prealbumin-like fold domain